MSGYRVRLCIARLSRARFTDGSETTDIEICPGGIEAADLEGLSRFRTATCWRRTTFSSRSRTEATRITTIVCMLQTIAGSGQKCLDFCGRRGFEERQVPISVREIDPDFLTNDPRLTSNQSNGNTLIRAEH